MAAALDPLLEAARELESFSLDQQVDSAFDEATRPLFTETTTTTTSPAPPPPPTTDLDLTRYEQMFDLQTKQLKEIQSLNRDSLDRLLEMMERLGFADAYKAKLTNFDLVLRSILGVGESAGEPQEPEVPDPGSQ